MGLVLATVMFAVFVVTFPNNILIIILNGVFFGTMAALAVAYGGLLWNAVLGVRPYDRVRQMTIGFALCWLAYSLSASASIYLRVSGYDVTSSALVAASRYVAVLAAVLQVTAPDFGLGLFHGRDRKVLITGAVVGVIIAVVLVYSQTEEVLAKQGPLPVEVASSPAVGAPMDPRP